MNEPHCTQRLGAYAVVFNTDRGDERVLLTRISPVGYPAGSWTLPGGGVDHGESPHVAVVRELYEETGLVASSTRLVDVHDVHVVAVGRDDRYEDYHGVHLLYAVDANIDTPLQVIDVGGSTDLAQWVRLDDVADLRVLPMVTYVLERRDQFSS